MNMPIKTCEICGDRFDIAECGTRYGILIDYDDTENVKQKISRSYLCEICFLRVKIAILKLKGE